MVPNVGRFDPTKGSGASFTAAASYILQAHSNQAIKDGQTSGPSRVGWTWASPELSSSGPVPTGASIGQQMQFVVDNQTAIKKAAGVSTRGRKLEGRPEYTVSFSLPPEQKMSPAEWHKFITFALPEMGLPPGHQVFAAVHTDTDSQHLHMLINRVNAKTGKVWNPNNDFIRWQAACDDWCKANNLNPCPARRERIERTREWVANQPADPAKRDRSKGPQIPTAAPVALNGPLQKSAKRHKSHAEKRAMEKLRAALPEDRQALGMETARLAAEDFAAAHAKQWKDLAALEKSIAGHNRAAAKTLAAQREIALSIIKDRAFTATTFTGVISDAWHTGRREAQHKKHRAVMRKRWIEWQRNEESFLGQRANGMAIRAWAKRNGIKIGLFDLLDASTREEYRKRIEKQMNMDAAKKRGHVISAEEKAFRQRNAADRKAVWDDYKSQLKNMPRGLKTIRTSEAGQERRKVISKAQSQEWADFAERLISAQEKGGAESGSSGSNRQAPGLSERDKRLNAAMEKQAAQREARLSGKANPGQGYER